MTVTTGPGVIAHNTVDMNAYMASLSSTDEEERGNNLVISVSGGQRSSTFDNVAVIPMGWTARLISLASAVNIQVNNNTLALMSAPQFRMKMQRRRKGHFTSANRVSQRCHS